MFGDYDEIYHEMLKWKTRCQRLEGTIDSMKCCSNCEKQADTSNDYEYHYKCSIDSYVYEAHHCCDKWEAYLFYNSLPLFAICENLAISTVCTLGRSWHGSCIGS
jgi:hypothetical protein